MLETYPFLNIEVKRFLLINLKIYKVFTKNLSIQNSHLIVYTMGNPRDIHVNPKEDTLSQPDGFLEGALSQLIGGEEQLGTSPKEVVDQI
jgi:hypothetical protein